MVPSLAMSNERAATRMPPRRLGQLLIEKRLITEAQLAHALDRQRAQDFAQPLGVILTELGLVTQQQVCETLAASIGIPFIHLAPEIVQRAAFGCLPLEFLEKHNLLPMAVTGSYLTIAIDHFTDVFLIEEIGRRSGLHVHAIAATPDNIRAVRQAVAEKLEASGSDDPAPRPAGSADGLRDILAQIDVNELKVVQSEERVSEADLISSAAESPVVRLVNYIIKTGVDLRASDIHIEPDDASFLVRFRVDGELQESVRPSAQLLPSVVSRIKIMAQMDISERRLPQDGGMTVTLGERSVDLRVSTMPTKLGEKVVLRILDRTGHVRRIDALGMNAQMAAEFREAIEAPFGMILVTGPTGSGKTTTLYAALAEITSSTYNVSTIEDPVEIRLRGANQSQVQPQAGFTFARALRSLLRQDPDVIMVGEIRDPETATLATEAALTGHLVLSTLHTNDAPTAVPRLINMGVQPYLVAASLRCVLAQRLVRRLCQHCAKPGAPTPVERAMLTSLRQDVSIDTVRSPVGCARCGQAGFIGRVGIFELLRLDEEMLSAVARDPTTQSFYAIIRSQNAPTLLDDGLAKLRDGVITVAGLAEVVARRGGAASGAREAGDGIDQAPDGAAGGAHEAAERSDYQG